MKTYILLLRGVMPTGKNKVPMAELRAALAAAGLLSVRTYIQSGNVILSTTHKQSAVEALVHRVIATEFGGDIPVMARTPAYLRKVLADNPFADQDPARQYITVFDSAPAPEKVQAFEAQSSEPDYITLAGDVAYTLCATKYSDLKINNNVLERRLQRRATTRIRNTIAKLLELSEH